MRKLLIVFLALMMVSVGMSSAAIWDIQKLFTGRMMVPYGASWYADDQTMYFGTDKDVSIKYNTTSGQGEVVGMAAVSNLSIAMESGEDITFAGGDSKFDIDAGTGITSTTSGVNSLNGNTYVTGTKTFMVVGGASTFGSSLRANKITSNSTIDVGVNASTTISTTLTSTSTKTVYDIDASSANVTLTLPDAATVPGRVYFISTSGNPGSNYVRITATGGDDINANNYLVSTDQWSNAWIVASNGAYRAVTCGTWAAHA